VVTPKDKAVGITETVRRISVGAADHVPFVQVTNLARTMEHLKKAGIWIVGTSDHADKLLYQLDLKGPLALVIGAEEKGMRRLTEENCDFLAKLPMAGRVECLNASVSAGVCLYEAEVKFRNENHEIHGTHGRRAGRMRDDLTPEDALQSPPTWLIFRVFRVVRGFPFFLLG
jgi:tRNA G18 (ribose-2'-O)-methylase SpoU